MIQIINFKEGDILIYPLCLLRIAGAENETEGFIKNLSVHNSCAESFPIQDCGMNALILLIMGENKIEIQCGFMKVYIRLFYEPPDHNRSVRLIYVTCLNEEKFQGPSDMKRDANEAVRRIQIGALLMQTFLAESLYSEGLGRKTFQLEMTKMGMPKVFVIQLPLTIQESYKLSEQKLWETIAMQILSSPLASRSCKYLAFFCGTRFSNPQSFILKQEKDILAHTKGHISLGGGGLALVGTGALYSWAPTIKEIIPCLRSKMKVNSLKLMDFSGTRGTWGSCFGTHLGSVLHELGHTFDLGHTPHGIMSRGFEDFHIFFTSTFIKIIKDENDNEWKQKKPVKSNMTSSLIKGSQTFTTDFVRKSIENISMVVEPPRDPIASSVVYSPCSTPKTVIYEPFNLKDNNANDPTSPGFERHVSLSLCLSQNIQKVEFAPKSPNPYGEEKFFKSPVIMLKNLFSPANITLNEKCINKNNSVIPDNFQDKVTPTNEGKTPCRAFFSRSNAVLLAYHKWLTGSNEERKPELRASVLCSNNGIRVVELRDMKMMAFHHWEYLNDHPPPIIHLPWAQVPHWPQDQNIEVVAIDNEGGILKGCSIPRPL